MKRWFTKKRWFAFHGWLGLTFGLPLFVICLSGAFAVISWEIDRFIHPEMNVEAPADPGVRPLGWDELVKRIEEASPGGEVMMLDVGADRDAAWTASVAFSPRDERLVFIDPWSGEVVGQRTPFHARSFFRIFHKQFYILEGPYWPHGRLVVGIFSFVLLFSVVSGLVFYKGWWKSLLRLRIRHGKRVLASDLHRLVGAWTLVLALLFAVTGMWYFTERGLEDLGVREHDPMPEMAESDRAQRAEILPRKGLDELVEVAERAYPGFRVETVILGFQPGALVHFFGEGTAVLADSDAVHIDPYEGRVVAVEKAHEMALAERLESMVNPLHFGRFGGVWSKAIWAAAGLMLAVGILAGAVIWWMRSRRATAGFFRRAPIWSVASLVLNLAILVLAAFSTTLFIRQQVRGAEGSVPGKPLGVAAVGPWKVEVFEQGKQTRVHLIGEGDPNFRGLSLWRGDSSKPAGLAAARGLRTTFFGEVGSAADGALHLEIEDWNGVRHRAVFPAGVTDRPWLLPPEPPTVPWSMKALVVGFFALVFLPVCWWLVMIR